MARGAASMTRIIIAEHDDIDAAQLCAEGIARGLDMRWFKLGLPSSSYSAIWSSEASPVLKCEEVELSETTLSEARWIFHREMRLKKEPYVKAVVGNEQENDFCMREWSALFSSALLAFKFGLSGHKWVSAFKRADFSDRKLFLLQFATRLGIAVPALKIGTTFPEISGQAVVVKAINADEFVGDRYFPTTLLDAVDAEKYTGQRSECPSLVQERINAVSELRAYYVRGSWLCLTIDRLSFPGVDLRYAKNIHIDVVESLPDSLGQPLSALCDELEMGYCVFDVLVDSKGRNWLVDVTPNGTWAWYEKSGGINITNRILDALERES
jgi:hypothetical protein